MRCVNSDVMADWKTIRVPADVYEDAKARKEEHGVTWGQYVDPHAWHSVFDEPSEAPTGETIDITDQLDATQKDVNEAVDELKGRLDDLESRLPRKVAREIQG